VDTDPEQKNNVAGSDEEINENVQKENDEIHFQGIGL
jgi:hypothetical protein